MKASEARQLSAVKNVARIVLNVIDAEIRAAAIKGDTVAKVYLVRCLCEADDYNQVKEVIIGDLESRDYEIECFDDFMIISW